MKRMRIEILYISPGISWAGEDFDQVEVGYMADGQKFTWIVHTKVLKTTKKLFQELKMFAINEAQTQTLLEQKKLEFNARVDKIMNNNERLV